MFNVECSMLNEDEPVVDRRPFNIEHSPFNIQHFVFDSIPSDRRPRRNFRQFRLRARLIGAVEEAGDVVA
jgi:hypothetical protein